MDRISLEKYHSEPEWRAEYEAALAMAENSGITDADALDYAAAAADIAITQAVEATAKRKADLDATRARLAAREGKEAEASASPAPAPVAAGLAKAIARINAGRGAPLHSDHGPAQADEAEAPEPPQADGWSKTRDRINAGR